MDAQGRFLAGLVCSNPSLSSVVHAFKAIWLSQFWSPIAVQGDGSFNKAEFLEMLHSLQIKLHPTPHRTYFKNVLERNHGIIRSIFCV